MSLGKALAAATFQGKGPNSFLQRELSQQQYPPGRASVNVNCSGNCSVTSGVSSKGKLSWTGSGLSSPCGHVQWQLHWQFHGHSIAEAVATLHPCCTPLQPIAPLWGLKGVEGALLEQLHEHIA